MSKEFKTEKGSLRSPFDENAENGTLKSASNPGMDGSKSDFEDANFIHSPFVDEVANRGEVSEAERAAIVANRLFLAKQAASDENIRKMAEQKTTEPKVTAFTGDTRGTVQKQREKGSKFEEALRAAQGR